MNTVYFSRTKRLSLLLFVIIVTSLIVISTVLAKSENSNVHRVWSVAVYRNTNDEFGSTADNVKPEEYELVLDFLQAITVTEDKILSSVDDTNQLLEFFDKKPAMLGNVAKYVLDEQELRDTSIYDEIELNYLALLQENVQLVLDGKGDTLYDIDSLAYKEIRLASGSHINSWGTAEEFGNMTFEEIEQLHDEYETKLQAEFSKSSKE